MFGQDRTQIRRFFKVSWDKRLRGEALQPLESLVAEVIAQHPEYHRLFADEDQLQQDFDPDSGQINPWLHLGMHVTLGEQIAADRPAGIRGLYSKVLLRAPDRHAAEHAVLDCLGVALWEAQQAGHGPDEQRYLDCIRRLSR